MPCVVSFYFLLLLLLLFKFRLRHKLPADTSFCSGSCVAIFLCWVLCCMLLTLYYPVQVSLALPCVGRHWNTFKSPCIATFDYMYQRVGMHCVLYFPNSPMLGTLSRLLACEACHVLKAATVLQGVLVKDVISHKQSFFLAHFLDLESHFSCAVLLPPMIPLFLIVFFCIFWYIVYR